MREQRFSEARVLAGLAEPYARLGEVSKRAELTVETMDLKLLFAAMNVDQELVRQRFWVREGDDPDRSVKVAFWRQRNTMMIAAREVQTALMRRVWKAEQIARDCGGTVEVTEAGRVAEEQTARWVELTDQDIAKECDGGQSSSTAS